MKNEDLFKELIKRVETCTKCERMEHRRKVLGTQCGNLHSHILFIGEAPGRLGAELSGVPFLGDQTGDNFNNFLGSINLSRQKIFITNTVLCNPRDLAGNNDKPLDSEINKCSVYLRSVIQIVNPKIIITLGGKALKGLDYINKHNIVLKRDVSAPQKWWKYTVFPLYHPSPKAFMTRSEELQYSDYARLCEYIRTITDIG